MTDDPGMVWSPTAHQPNHNATVKRDGEHWIGACWCLFVFTSRDSHDGAMIDTLNHRSEYR